MTPGPDEVAGRLPGRLAITFGGLMHLTVGAFVLASARILPWPVAAGLSALWVGIGVLGWRWRHTRPLVVLLLPFTVAAAWWLAATTLGER